MSTLTLVLRATAAWLETRKLETDVRIYRESVRIEKRIQQRIVDSAARGDDGLYVSLLDAELRNEAELRRALGQRVGLTNKS
jgi:hypothetical protein